MSAQAEFTPRLNHVAITMDPAALDDRGRADILDFYSAVFGWTEGDNTGEKGNPLILYTGAFAQFIYLLPGTPALQCPSLDHFGLEMPTVAALEGVVARATSYRARDDRVRIIDIDTRTTHGSTHDYELTNAYIGFLLPMMVELQHIQRVAR
jgi:hypothetical protein